MANNSDIHRDPETTAKALKDKARQHNVRVSQNANDSPINRPKEFRNFTTGGNFFTSSGKGTKPQKHTTNGGNL